MAGKDIFGLFSLYDSFDRRTKLISYGVPSADFHHRHYLPQRCEPRSSSNGVLLCQAAVAETKCVYYICNPVTEEWKELPTPISYHGSDPPIVLFFEPSFTSSQTEYNLVCPVSFNDQQTFCFEIYSSKTRLWRQVAIECSELANWSLKKLGFGLNGKIYWETTSGSMVLTYDLENQVHELFSLPHGCTSSGGLLTHMDGKLFYVYVHEDNRNAEGARNNCYKVDIYVGCDFKLEKSFTLDFGTEGKLVVDCHPLAVVNSETVIFLMADSVVSYCVTDDQFKVLDKYMFNCSETRYIPHVKSLVRLEPPN